MSPSIGPPPGSRSVRRSRHLVAWWETDGSRLCDYATGVTAPARPGDLRLLEAAKAWIPVDELLEAFERGDASEARASVERLVDLGFLKASDRRPDARELAFSRWRGWNPSAGFFHARTRDVAYAHPSTVPVPLAVPRGETPLIKRYADAPRLTLNPFPRLGELAESLLERRTWRRFGAEPLELDALAALLGLTFAVQRWMHLPSGARGALKTSPSGGARHSIEAYLLALRVEGLAAGTYHYRPDTHELEDLERPLEPARLEAFLPGQPWFREAAAVVLMTSVFERVRGRYDFPRAYRIVLLEAGHLCQTFCLVATRRGLAPFCTAALADSAIEEHLELDGIGESVLYAAGVGARPRGVAWAPYETGEAPSTSPPAHERRSDPRTPAARARPHLGSAGSR